MKTKDVMSHPLETISPNMTLLEAATRMAESDVGMLLVSDEGRLKGTVTDRDICVRAVARGCAPAETLVHSAMTSNLVTCDQDADLQEAAERMADHNVRRLLVMEKGLPVGVVSVGDLARARKDPAIAGRALELSS